MAGFDVVLRKNGKVQRRMGPYETQKAAKHEAQLLADAAASGVKVWVEKRPNRAHRAPKQNAGHKPDGRKMKTFGPNALGAKADIYFNPDYNEYVVVDSRFAGDPNTWYHTDSKEDAIGTARHIVAPNPMVFKNPYDDRPDEDYGKVHALVPSGYRGGKPAHDEDYKAGFKAGVAALKKKSASSFTISDIKKRYSRVSKKHGSWWIDGFRAAVEVELGIATPSTHEIHVQLGIIPRRQNTHLRVGDGAKHSLQYKQWLRKYGKNHYSPEELQTRIIAADDAEYDVVEVHPWGYTVFGHEGEETFADEALVSVDSWTDAWPGTHYKGQRPSDADMAAAGWYTSNPGHDWIQKVDEEIEADDTEGAFTRQARRAGYQNTMEFARAVMAGWRSGKKSVFNKKTRKQQGITKKTMLRANFALNVQKRNPGHLRIEQQAGGRLGLVPQDQSSTAAEAQIQSLLRQYFQSGMTQVRAFQLIKDTGLSLREVLEAADSLGYQRRGDPFRPSQYYFVPYPHRNPPLKFDRQSATERINRLIARLERSSGGQVEAAVQEARKDLGAIAKFWRKKTFDDAEEMRNDAVTYNSESARQMGNRLTAQSLKWEKVLKNLVPRGGGSYRQVEESLFLARRLLTGQLQNPTPLPSNYAYRPQDAPTVEEACKVRSWLTEYFEAGMPKVRVSQVVQDTGLSLRKVVESAEDHLGYVMHGEGPQAYFIPRPHRNPDWKQVGSAVGSGIRRAGAATGRFVAETGRVVGEEAKRAALYTKAKDLELCAVRLGINVEDLLDGKLDPGATLDEIADRIDSALEAVEAQGESIKERRASRKKNPGRSWQRLMNRLSR